MARLMAGDPERGPINVIQPMRWACILLLASTSAWARAADREVRGRVVDEADRAVAEVRVAPFWSGNGTGKHPDGSPLDLKKTEDVRAFWGKVGTMEPRGRAVTTTGLDGSFTLKVSDIDPAIMAMDRSRERGGLASVTKIKPGEAIEIRLRPLVRVRARFAGPTAGTPPYWSHAYVMTPEDPTRPLDSRRLAQCGSLDGRFEVSLPPGRYGLDAYGISKDDDDIDLGVSPNPEFVVTGEVREMDLGLLKLTTRPPSLSKRIDRAKSIGVWGDFAKLAGGPPPSWHVDDAQGVARDVQASDFRGKWLLIEFWGLSCRPCLARGMPALIRFQEEHQGDRDRFQILALCIDFDGELKSIADVNRALKPIVEHVWGGKSLPFPVLLDTTFLTWERFGLPGLGSAMLINPEGKVVAGDLATLDQILKEKPHGDRHPH